MGRTKATEAVKRAHKKCAVDVFGRQTGSRARSLKRQRDKVNERRMAKAAAAALVGLPNPRSAEYAARADAERQRPDGTASKDQRYEHNMSDAALDARRATQGAALRRRTALHKVLGFDARAAGFTPAAAEATRDALVAAKRAKLSAVSAARRECEALHCRFGMSLCRNIERFVVHLEEAKRGTDSAFAEAERTAATLCAIATSSEAHAPAAVASLEASLQQHRQGRDTKKHPNKDDGRDVPEGKRLVAEARVGARALVATLTHEWHALYGASRAPPLPGTDAFESLVKNL